MGAIQVKRARLAAEQSHSTTCPRFTLETRLEGVMTDQSIRWGYDAQVFKNLDALEFPERKKEICRRVLSGETFCSVAQDFNLSRERVRQIAVMTARRAAKASGQLVSARLANYMRQNGFGCPNEMTPDKRKAASKEFYKWCMDQVHVKGCAFPRWKTLGNLGHKTMMELKQLAGISDKENQKIETRKCFGVTVSLEVYNSLKETARKHAL
jgi:hypothetical protein